MENIASAQFKTPLGDITAVAGDNGLLFVHFSDVDIQYIPSVRGLELASTNHHLKLFENELQGYFRGDLKSFSTPCVIKGTPFQKKVWQALERIPYGMTVSYADVATSIHQPSAYRAVALANRFNVFAIRFPCHRVIKSNGDLCGYNGGVYRKQWLIDHEKRYA